MINEKRGCLEVDVLFVGAGPANLSAAIHLMSLVENHNRGVKSGRLKGPELQKPNLLVIEKAEMLGGHSFSGTILRPKALQELLPDYRQKGMPIEGEVIWNELHFLSKTGRFSVPFIPKQFENQGNFIISLSKFVRWLGAVAGEMGVDIATGFCGKEVVFAGSRTIGVIVGDKGVSRNNVRKDNYQAGVEINAALTVFGEGARGSLVKQLDKKYSIFHPEYPQVFEIGVKEVFKMPEGSLDKGRVVHLMGWPFDNQKDGRSKEGGAFIYHMADNLLSVGLVVALNTEDPLLDPHAELQRLKRHPFVSKILEGGIPVHYGCKNIPCGGLFTIPKLCFAGGLIVGDSAGFVNTVELKGAHLAMKSGMLAAETIYEALLKDDFSQEGFLSYSEKIGSSYIFDELHKYRNFRQTFKGIDPVRLGQISLQNIFGGAFVRDELSFVPDYKHTKPLKELYKNADYRKYGDVKHNSPFLPDKLTDLYYSGTKHEEDQPVHLKVSDPSVCASVCRDNYNCPCTHFCPAQVYELDNSGQLSINPANCLHCKTCEIKCPLQNVSFTLPEAGGGPNYMVC